MRIPAGNANQKNEATGVLQALFVKASYSSHLPGQQKTIQKQEKADKLVEWFRKLPLDRQESIEEKAVAFCREQHPSIYDGYVRNRNGGGDAFERYREMLVKTFIESRTKLKAA